MNLLCSLRHSNVITYMGACLEQALPPHSVVYPGMCCTCIVDNVLVMIAP